MRQRVLTMLVALMAVTALTRAQQKEHQITGRIADQSTKEGLPNAAVVLIQRKDSVLVTNVVSDEKGVFVFKSTKPGDYLLVVSYMGYLQFSKPVMVNDSTTLITLGTLELKPKGLTLNQVEIIEIKPPIVVKEDTIEFNAGSFKTRENALVEELLKKLPGVQVDKDGNIKANGEKINKVLVDGKPFFGNDPKMSTRNLPADIIDKVQLINQKSEQAQFTGIADGDSEKILNLTIKEDRKKGTFGRASVGYGTDERYAVTANFNRFRHTQQFSVLAGSNNVNTSGFTPAGGGNNGATGITKNWSGGVNYSDNPIKNLRFSGSYFLNKTERENERSSERENIFRPDSSSFVNSINRSISDQLNHRINMRMDYTIDSFHSILLTPNLSFTSGNDVTESGSTTLNNAKDTVNRSVSRSINKSDVPSLNVSALLKKKFAKKGRTLSANINVGFNSSERESINQSFTDFRDGVNPHRLDTIDQKVIQENKGRNLNVKLSYTEPVFTDRFLEVTYAYLNNYTGSNRYTYDKAKGAEGYTQVNDSLTNLFNNVFSNHQTGVSIMTQKLRYNYTLGVNVQLNNLSSDNISKRTTIEQHTTNISPLAKFNYNFSQNKRMAVTYRGQTQQPTLEQLQPVPDLSNRLLVKLGNPDLKPSFSNNIGVNFNDYDQNTMRNMFVSLNGNFDLNRIVNSNTITKDGVQIVKPVNVNGNYSLNAYIVNGFSLNKAHRAFLNSNTAILYSRDVSLINERTNYTNTLNINQGLNVNLTHKELLELAVGGNVNYNRARFSDNKANNTNYFNYGLTLDFNLNLPLGFIIGGDVDYTANTGRSEGYNTRFTMVNAFVSKSMFSKKQGLLRLQVFDLLNQNVSVSRTVSDNYIEDTRSMVLRRYFMLSFSYFFNRFGGKAPKISRNQPVPPPPVALPAVQAF